MPLKRPTLEFCLSKATNELNLWVKKLEERGMDPKDYKRCPKWRHFNARCRQIRRRMIAVDAIAAREAECARRKAEKSAPAAAE